MKLKDLTENIEVSISKFEIYLPEYRSSFDLTYDRAEGKWYDPDREYGYTDEELDELKVRELKSHCYSIAAVLME